jgi:hypothetical protein
VAAAAKALPGEECSTTAWEVVPPVNTTLERSETELLAKKHIALFIAVASLGAADVGTSASASTNTWSKSRCEAWAKSFRKQHPQRSSAHKKEALKVLKAHNCPRGARRGK